MQYLHISIIMYSFNLIFIPCTIFESLYVKIFWHVGIILFCFHNLFQLWIMRKCCVYICYFSSLVWMLWKVVAFPLLLISLYIVYFLFLLFFFFCIFFLHSTLCFLTKCIHNLHGSLTIILMEGVVLKLKYKGLL